MLEEPRCSIRRCRHFWGVDQPDGTEMTERVVCKAFPREIPDRVAYGENQHSEPLPGQGNNIVYEREED